MFDILVRKAEFKHLEVSEFKFERFLVTRFHSAWLRIEKDHECPEDYWIPHLWIVRGRRMGVRGNAGMSKLGELHLGADAFVLAWAFFLIKGETEVAKWCRRYAIGRNFGLPDHKVTSGETAGPSDWWDSRLPAILDWIVLQFPKESRKALVGDFESFTALHENSKSRALSEA